MKQQQHKHGIARRTGVGLAKAWSYSLGITSLARTGQRIGGNLGALGKHVHRKLTDSPANYRHESFEEAVDRLGLDEAHLVRQARAFNVRAISWLAALALATGWLAYLPWSNSPFLHFVLCLGLMFMAFAKSFTWRFRYAQIRDQELYSFGPWFLSPGRW